MCRAARWVQAGDYLTAAPLILPALGCCLFNCNSNKYAGCYPLLGNLGGGYVSKPLVNGGYHTSVCGWPTTCPFPLSVFACKKPTSVSDASFTFKTATKRSDVTDAAWWLRCYLCFPPCFCQVGNHLQAFVLWSLYKGAYHYQNDTENIFEPKVEG